MGRVLNDRGACVLRLIAPYAEEDIQAMNTRTVRQPGTDDRITIEANPGRVVISLAGRIIADTRHALTLREGAYPAVQYIPRRDVDMTQLQRSEHTSYCPYKGDAAYYSLPAGGARSVNAAWSYESPRPAVAAIKDHLAFYPERVDGVEEGPLP